jgi:hypothetical protein
VRTAIGLLAALYFGCASAAPFAAQVGDTRLALDAPPGFADTITMGSPRLQELAESISSPSNRILLFGISDADLRRFQVGDSPDLRRYMVASTPLSLERERASTSSFRRLVEDSMRDLGPLAPQDQDVGEHLLKQPPGAVSYLAELRRDASVASVLQGSRLPPKQQGNIFYTPQEKPQFVLSTTTLMVVRGKAMHLSVYTRYEAPADLAWIRGITLRWIEDLQRLNR